MRRGKKGMQKGRCIKGSGNMVKGHPSNVSSKMMCSNLRGSGIELRQDNICWGKVYGLGSAFGAVCLWRQGPNFKSTKFRAKF